MAKVTKKNATMTLVTDLFVKLSNLYNDIYIIKNTFIVAGKNPSDKILGSLECVIEQKYQDALTALVGKTKCIYVESVVDTKKYLQGVANELEPTDEIKEKTKKYLKEITDEKVIKKQLDTISAFDDRFNPSDIITRDCPVRWWSCIGDNAELIETVFELKSIFNLPIEVENDTDETQTEETYVTIAKQLLPLVTETNINNAYIGTTGKRHGADNDLLEVMLDFRFTHFRMMIIYNIVVLPWVDAVQFTDEDTSETEN